MGEGEWHEAASIRWSVCCLLPRGAAEPGEGGPPAAVTWILGVSEGGLAASKTVHAHPQVDIPVGIPADHAWWCAGGGAPCRAGAEPRTG